MGWAISVRVRLEVRLRDDQRLAADALVVEIDPGLCFAANTRDLGDGTRAELAMPHTRAGHDGHRILRFVFRLNPARDGRARSPPRSRHETIVVEGRRRFMCPVPIRMASAAATNERGH